MDMFAWGRVSKGGGTVEITPVEIDPVTKKWTFNNSGKVMFFIKDMLNAREGTGAGSSKRGFGVYKYERYTGKAGEGVVESAPAPVVASAPVKRGRY